MKRCLILMLLLGLLLTGCRKQTQPEQLPAAETIDTQANTEPAAQTPEQTLTLGMIDFDSEKSVLRVASDFAALVDLQLYAEVSWPVSVENRFRAIIIVVDDLIFQNMIAVFAIEIVLAVSQIICILAVDQFPTAFTVCVMAVIASLAERMRPRTGIGIIPKPLPTV